MQKTSVEVYKQIKMNKNKELTKKEIQMIISEKITTMRLEKAKEESERELLHTKYMIIFSTAFVLGGFFVAMVLQ